MITVLAGGVGGSKFIHGLSLLDITNSVAIINTGDDIEKFGLYVSPDIDINIYRLANVIHEQGWGFEGDTYQFQEILSTIYQEDCWFNLGDKDIATHIYRSNLLKEGYSLSEITQKMCEKFNTNIAILPMSNNPVSTYVDTPDGEYHFQEYLIKRRMSDKVHSIKLAGIEEALPAPGVLEAINESSIIFIAPSNFYVSINPILSIPGVREAIKNSNAKVIGISPIIGGNAVKGPLAKMMKDFNVEISPYGVAQLYDGLLDGFIIDHQDHDCKADIQNLDISVLTTNTILDTEEQKETLIREALLFVENL
ncbi:2-phospho-L-lactate transferase [Neobacillus niacini]|uniref:2-phospho-L-lactate transferase n=1 Tax=Neobacillus niacini TaxID=86668 RepID=UPI003001CADC